MYVYVWFNIRKYTRTHGVVELCQIPLSSILMLPPLSWEVSAPLYQDFIFSQKKSWLSISRWILTTGRLPLRGKEWWIYSGFGDAAWKVRTSELFRVKGQSSSNCIHFGNTNKCSRERIRTAFQLSLELFSNYWTNIFFWIIL